MTNHPLKPGDRVLIAHNPHVAAAQNVVGTVQELRPRAGFMGCDLVEVEFTDPATGETCVRPFATDLLLAGSPDELIRMAERHEAQAAALRALAKERS